MIVYVSCLIDGGQNEIKYKKIYFIYNMNYCQTYIIIIIIIIIILLLFIFNVEINNNTITLVIKSRSAQRINPGSSRFGVWTGLSLRKK